MRSRLKGRARVAVVNVILPRRGGCVQMRKFRKRYLLACPLMRRRVRFLRLYRIFCRNADIGGFPFLWVPLRPACIQSTPSQTFFRRAIEELFKLSYKIVNRTIEVKTIVSTPFEKKIELFTEFDFLLKCSCFLPLRANSYVVSDGINYPIKRIEWHIHPLPSFKKYLFGYLRWQNSFLRRDLSGACRV